VTIDASDEGERCPAGVHLIDDAQRARVLAGQAFPENYAVAVLDGEKASSRAGFFTEIARALRFPDYFGHNWDAVYDCLTDPSVMSATGTVLLLDGFGHFARNDPEQWATGLKVLQDACVFWRPLSGPLLVLLFDPSAAAPDVPPLPARCMQTDEAARRVT
jgi:hypothetical protein